MLIVSRRVERGIIESRLGFVDTFNEFESEECSDEEADIDDVARSILLAELGELLNANKD